ncbi:hypothetical protein TNCV_1171531 [Trichonephila clavipes]|nr:hypothetical protein TNCV_1171531 [Trichonephila clavipes]
MSCGLKRFQASWRALFSSVMELGGCKMGCNLPPEHFSYIHDRIYIRGVRRPRHALDVFRFKEVINQHRSVTWRIMIHEYEVKTNSTSKQANIRLKNLVSVSLSSHRPCVKEMEVCAAIHHDTFTPLMENDVFPLCFLVLNVFHVLSISLSTENHNSD